LRKIAPTNLPVLLLGETGVGKDVFAERLHVLSPRSKRPFVRVHAAAIPEGLVESELFGHEAGAFTGATRAKVGLLEAADGGTVFIDEVGELSLALQVKLLRVLEDRRVQRVGAVVARRVDVRFVAASHRDPSELVRTGRMRQDFFQRLRGLTLRLPPLRERSREIPALADALLKRIAPGRSFSKAAQLALSKHPYFGNVRELRNVVERTALLSDQREIAAAALVFSEAQALESPPRGADAAAPAPSAEARRIELALRKTNGHQGRAAELLGISRRTLIHRLDEYGIARPRKRSAAEPPSAR
jgi:two-component system, NtrC family, response regulator AtoC